ncbi:potassium channel family protein [Halopiger thermotolerans]
MNPLYLGLGVVLLAVTVVDLLWTTLWVEGGAGPLTSRVMAWTWRLVRWVGSQNDRILSLSGPLVLVFQLSAWIAFLWIGWTFLFASARGALIDTLGTRAIGWSELLYFTGYTIFTLGNGDFVPRGDLWQLITTLATATGMLFITLSVTYVLSVLGAVTQKRSFASSVSALGSRGSEIVRTSWNGTAFQGVDVTVRALASQLETLTANHKAYPILHYFHSKQATQAPTRSIALFDDALTLYRFGVPERARPSALVVTNARSSVESYILTLERAFIEPASDRPPDPDLERLRDADIPTVPDREFEAAVAGLDERRRTLLALVESDVREWPADESA